MKPEFALRAQITVFQASYETVWLSREASNAGKWEGKRRGDQQEGDGVPVDALLEDLNTMVETIAVEKIYWCVC